MVRYVICLLLLAGLLAGCGPKLIDKRVDRDWTIRFEGYSDADIRKFMPRFKSEFPYRTSKYDAFKNQTVVIRWSINDIELEEKLRKFFIQEGMPSESVTADRALRTCVVRRQMMGGIE